jgi:hypothetical protein
MGTIFTQFCRDTSSPPPEPAIPSSPRRLGAGGTSARAAEQPDFDNYPFALSVTALFRAARSSLAESPMVFVEDDESCGVYHEAILKFMFTTPPPDPCVSGC